jgi:GH43 family beta-xylosidase
MFAMKRVGSSVVVSTVVAALLVAMALPLEGQAPGQQQQLRGIEQGGVEFVTNPVVPQRADPWVYRHTDGMYYFTGSVPAYDRVELRKASTLQGLAFAEPKAVWHKHESGPMSQHIWAPELHRWNGKWYVHFAAGRVDAPFDIRMYVLENASADPLEGEWEEKGQIQTRWDTFALDATQFEHRGKLYLVWAQRDPEIRGNSNLYIAEMENPWTLRSEQVMITRPEHDWEIQGYLVNEGAAVLHRHGRLFITYSGSATDARYAMGLLWADEDADLLDPASWSKSPDPVFVSNPEAGQFGPGHNSFTTSHDGTVDVMVYHARTYSNIRGNSLYDPNRQGRMQRIEWTDDGFPVFGVPVPDGPHVINEGAAAAAQ